MPASEPRLLQVTSPESPLKATLVWTDPPSFPGSARALINDLDLVLVGPDGAYYYGNALVAVDEAHPAYPVKDRLNNCEQAGAYRPPVPALIQSEFWPLRIADCDVMSRRLPGPLRDR